MFCDGKRTAEPTGSAAAQAASIPDAVVIPIPPIRTARRYRTAVVVGAAAAVRVSPHERRIAIDSAAAEMANVPVSSAAVDVAPAARSGVRPARGRRAEAATAARADAAATDIPCPPPPPPPPCRCADAGSGLTSIVMIPTPAAIAATNDVLRMLTSRAFA
jgi:hypothetical protein